MQNSFFRGYTSCPIEPIEGCALAPDKDKTPAPCIIFGVTSIPDKPLQFRVMFENGAQVARLPIWDVSFSSMIFSKKIRRQIWNCFSRDISVVTYPYLKDMKCSFKVGGEVFIGKYHFTVECSGGNMDEGGDLGYKDFHIISEKATGSVFALPNPNIAWSDGVFTSPFSFDSPPQYKTLPSLGSIE
jgi:hypothetical protein